MNKTFNYLIFNSQQMRHRTLLNTTLAKSQNTGILVQILIKGLESCVILIRLICIFFFYLFDSNILSVMLYFPQ